MNYKEFESKVRMMFGKFNNETPEAYEFYIKEALFPFTHSFSLEKYWEKVKEYDGRTIRPRFAFFKSLIAESISDPSQFVFFDCECGAKLSQSSDGGCPLCHGYKTKIVITNKPRSVIPAQPDCYDCSIYSRSQTGPKCPEYGTVSMTRCQRDCDCRTCCKFNYLRLHDPQRLKPKMDVALKALPKTLTR